MREGKHGEPRYERREREGRVDGRMKGRLKRGERSRTDEGRDGKNIMKAVMTG